jgi:hypothetical protein
VRAFCRVLAILLLASGCTESCACGEGAGEQSGAKAPQPAAAGQPAAARPGDGPGGPGGGGAPQIGEAATWLPAPDSQLTRQLAAAKQALETTEVEKKLTDGKLLSRPLADRLGTLQAESATSSTVREGSDAKLAVSARNYKQGSKTVRVKITDTGMLPNARGVVSRRLTMIGSEAVGNERGAFVRGYPAVIAHFPEQQVSRASAVIGSRYLVQVMVRGATGAEDALRVIEQLDFGQLAPKQGKIPKAVAPSE